MQSVKDLALSLEWLGSLLWCGSDPCLAWEIPDAVGTAPPPQKKNLKKYHVFKPICTWSALAVWRSLVYMADTLSQCMYLWFPFKEQTELTIGYGTKSYEHCQELTPNFSEVGKHSSKFLFAGIAFSPLTSGFLWFLINLSDVFNDSV